MPISVCFMVMPFGKKPTGAEPGKAPAQIDFDALWDKALRPMIEKDLGYLPIRADQDAGSLIIQPMIERLAISDLVIADVSIANANVYYEVGVRHAAKKLGCVMIAADWAKPLFDMAQMRRLTYPLPEGTVEKATADAIRNNLKDGIKKAAELTSPVFQSIRGYPDKVDPKQTESFHDIATQLARFQAETGLARTLPPTQAAEEVKRLVGDYGQEAGNLPSVALELIYLLRDTREWTTALEFINGLPQRVQELPAIREQHALILGRTGQHLKAIAELEALIRTEGDSSERSGLMGGRYKVLYEGAPDRPSRLQYLNKAIANYERGMMLDLNDYYPSSNLPRLYRERGQQEDEEKAARAAKIAVLACERSRKKNPDDPWIPPTLLGAAFDAGDVASARRLLDEMNEHGTAAFHIDTTISDLRRSWILLGKTEAAEELAAILAEFQLKLDPNGTVTAVAGRRVDAADAKEHRFPPENEALVAWRIRNMLMGTASKAVVSSAACGADILALESAGGLGLERRVVLPFDRARFRSTSVTDRGPEWGARFDQILGQLDSKDIIELNLEGDENAAYAAANVRIIEEARKLASDTDRFPLAAIVWNGFTRGKGDLTDAFRQLAAERKMGVISIPTL